MTVPSDVNKHIYAGNGVTRVWPYTFLLYDASHLQVWVKRGDEESALLERGYVLNEQEKTVTYPPEGTGEAPLSAEDQIIIMRVVPVLHHHARRAGASIDEVEESGRILREDD